MKLKDYRKLAGLTRPAAAAALGVNTVTVWRWETGRVVPGAKVARRIMAWSKGAVTPNDFVGGMEQ